MVEFYSSLSKFLDKLLGGDHIKDPFVWLFMIPLSWLVCIISFLVKIVEIFSRAISDKKG